MHVIEPIPPTSGRYAVEEYNAGENETRFAVTNERWEVVANEIPTRRAALRVMRTLQGLPTCHDDLVDEGAYIHTRHPEQCGDNGDGESGPMPWYEPAWDEYNGDSHTLYFCGGVLVHVEEIDWDEVRFWERSDEDFARFEANEKCTFDQEDMGS